MSSWFWCHFFGGAPSMDASAPLRLLRSQGLAFELLDGRSPCGPGLVFFSHLVPGLLEFIRDVSLEGRERVLALSLSRSPLGTDAVWQLLAAGASDVFHWGDGAACPEIQARFERWRAVDELIASPRVQRNLIGVDRGWLRTLRQVIEVAGFSEASVLLFGETGTGKELVARLIHTLDRRENRRDLVVVDCGNIVPALSGSEFFGHERGAFTGAVASREGAFGLADGGTLFLDEVGELPLDLQSQLLRVIQEHRFKRVGGNAWMDTRFRLICATHRDLTDRVLKGEFRSDLYYRIASVTIPLPRLRERPSDILPLVRHFIAAERDGDGFDLDPAVQEFLVSREYKGNIRELRQLVTRILTRHVGTGPITPGDVPEDERPAAAGTRWREDALEQAIREALASGVSLEEIGRAAKDIAIRIALTEESGSIKRAAGRLGITERALQLRRAARRQSQASDDVLATEAEAHAPTDHSVPAGS